MELTLATNGAKVFEFKICADPPKPGPAYCAVLRAAILGFKTYLCTHFLSDSDTYPSTSASFRRSPGGGSSGRKIQVALGLRVLLCGGFICCIAVPFTFWLPCLMFLFVVSDVTRLFLLSLGCCWVATVVVAYLPF